MSAIKGMFDGKTVTLLEKPPSDQPSEVVVTFPAAVKESRIEYASGRTRGAALADVVDKAHMVISADGKPLAMQMDMADWTALMDWLEDVEDAEVLRERFRQRSERAVTTWEDFEAELTADGLL